MAIRSNPNQKFEELRLAADMARKPFEREGWLNLAFFLSQQYTEWHQETGSIREIPRPKKEQNAPRPVVNKIMHYVRQAHHEGIQDKPMGDVLPPTDDYGDISDAIVARSWVEWASSSAVTNFDRKQSRAALWAILAGSGYMKWAVDPKTGKPLIIAPGFFEIYLDPYCKDFYDGRYIIHSQFMDVEQVYETYGIEVPSAKVEKADEVKTALLRGMGAAPALNGCTVHELWMRPCRRYKEGLFVAWVGNEQLIAPDKLPYPHLIEENMLPFTQLGCIERPDSPYYLSPVQFLRPPQMELNKYHAQRLAIRERFANPKVWIPKELILDEEWDDSPGQILSGTSMNGTLEPKILQPATYPPSDDGDMLEQQMMHLVGQHEVSQAQVPGRVEAAKAIELLKESDASALATLRDTMRVSHEIGWYQELQLARTFQKTADMVLTYSREGLPEVKHFKAGALKPGFRIRTTMTTGLARSRTQRQEQLFRLWDEKIIQDPEMMAELMEVPLPSLDQDRANDTRLARNENLEMAKGTPITPNSWDDHAVHLREHNRYRKTHEFMSADAEVKKKFEYHCDLHEKLQRTMLQKQAQLQMILQGGQPGATPPPAAPSTPTQEEGSDGPQ